MILRPYECAGYLSHLYTFANWWDIEQYNSEYHTVCVCVCVESFTKGCEWGPSFWLPKYIFLSYFLQWPNSKRFDGMRYVRIFHIDGLECGQWTFASSHCLHPSAYSLTHSLCRLVVHILILKLSSGNALQYCRTFISFIGFMVDRIGISKLINWTVASI